MKYTTKIKNWIKENTKRSVTRTKSNKNIISNHTGNLKPKGLVKYKDGAAALAGVLRCNRCRVCRRHEGQPKCVASAQAQKQVQGQ